MAGVRIGAKVPKFSVPTTGGVFRMHARREGNLVIYFYPRDNTPGCTLEGSEFRDLAASFRRAQTLIVGISTDTIDSHRRFRDKMEFPFDLGSDEDHAVATLFGVWKQKNMYGRQMMGIERSTFLMDARGILRAEWRKVRVAGHAALVLAVARGL
jgi:peroxiredoxin Q/BCP